MHLRSFLQPGILSDKQEIAQALQNILKPTLQKARKTHSLEHKMRYQKDLDAVYTSLFGKGFTDSFQETFGVSYEQVQQKRNYPIHFYTICTIFGSRCKTIV